MRGLDTYHGRGVVGLGEDSDGNWYIELVGGVRVINTDPNMLKPDISPSTSGLQYLMTIMGADSTTMVLGIMSNGQMIQEWRVLLNPLEYQIYDPSQQELAWSPQAGGYNVKIQDVRRHPDERVAEGPTGPIEETENPGE